MMVTRYFAALDGGAEVGLPQWSKQRGRTDQRSCKCDSNVTLKREKGDKW